MVAPVGRCSSICHYYSRVSLDVKIKIPPPEGGGKGEEWKELAEKDHVDSNGNKE